MVGLVGTLLQWSRWTVGFVALVGMAGAVTTVADANADLTGKWRMSLNMDVGRATPLLELRQNEGKLSGTYTGRYGSSPVSGEVDGRTVTFAVGMETTTLQFRGEVQDDGTLAGTADFGDMGAVTWTAAREQSLPLLKESV
ncbi:MAG TPA: hypothetical protein VML95_06640 [Longimicrobiales bacterium]|nr:hypothetical protein [Longimicrobiales bacterium]